MVKQSKRIREIASKLDLNKVYTLAEAIDVLKALPPVKFDQSLELSLRTGVDSRKSDQVVRGTVTLPNGTGKRITIVVFARGDKLKEALDAGADFAGNDELLEKVKNGWTGFDVVVSTPDMMRDVGKLGKILGPRGLMPTPKAGTVTNDIGKAVHDAKAGKIEFKTDKGGVVNSLVGKLPFETSKLVGNTMALLIAILRSKPPTAKGQFMRSLYLSSTMGPGLKIDLQTISEIQGG